MSTVHARRTKAARCVAIVGRPTQLSTKTAPMKVAAAAAIIVAGSLVGPAPARAIPPVPLDPPCLDWSYTGTFTIVQNNGLSVGIANWSGASAPSDSNAASLFMADGTPAMIDDKGYPTKDKPGFGAAYNSTQQGTVSGGFQGNNVNLDIVWNGLNPKVATSNHYTGTIDRGVASGTETNTAGATGTWHSPNPLLCSHIPAI
jgi:hypothetical protein